MALPADRCDDLPLSDRPVIEWPNGARVAFWVAPDVEHYGYLPPLDGSRNPWPRSRCLESQRCRNHPPLQRRRSMTSRNRE